MNLSGESPRADVPAPITRLLAASRHGDEAAFDRVFSVLYEDLRNIARRHLRKERSGHTLNTTALVHESYVRLAGSEGALGEDRGHFFAIASRVMRRVLVDHARMRGAKKRGGDQIRVTLDPESAASDMRTTELLALDEALSRLAEHDPRLERVVECRFFGGLSAAETASALDVSLRTVERDWTRAKAYLYDALHA